MLTTKQRAVLSVVCETILPEFKQGPGEPVLTDVLDRVEHLIQSLKDPEDRERLFSLLTALDSPLVNLALAGAPASITKMSPANCLKVLDGWAHSGLGVRRAGFQALKRLANVAYYCWPPDTGTHPAWGASGYPGPLPQPEKQVDALPVKQIAADTTLECDVVIVGSGAGGGVVAGVLAQAGHDVIVLEKGVALSSRDMTQIEGEMLGKAYLDGGLLMTQSGSMPILAGSCLGGGTVINYTTSFRLPNNIRDEWSDLSGLSLFSDTGFTQSLDRVCARLNVGTDWTTPGARDEILERGLKAKGWHVARITRNVTHCVEGLECGYCGYGCRHGAKNDTTRTYLTDALAAGARIVTGCAVDRVIRTNGRATGVIGSITANGRTFRLEVKARVVVSACGAINTPALLIRSGTTNPNVGRGLRLHPASAVLGVFPERVEPWSGSLQTRYSEQFANFDRAYGVRFETAPVHLALAASAFGWEGPEKYREDVGRLGHTGLVGLLLRDRDPGRVAVSRAGLPRIHYDLSRRDAGAMHAGLRGGAEVLAAGGATEIVTLHSPPVRIRPGKMGWDGEFAERCSRRGYRHNRMSLISFHQMASCAMGDDPSRAVISETGETFETPGLYVADGSTFPTSSGVNPMITIMAIADQVAKAIGARL